MSIYLLECKRILSGRLTRLLLIGLILFAAVMAYLPVTFVEYSVFDEAGNREELRGFRAIAAIKAAGAPYAGAVTETTLSAALNQYQEGVRLYGQPHEAGFPVEAYFRYIAPSRLLVKLLIESNASPTSGMAADAMELNEGHAAGFYEQNAQHLLDIMRMEQKNHPHIQEQAARLYGRVKTPFTYYPGYSTDAVDYLTLYLFLLTLGLTALMSSCFALEYRTGADDILRCTKHGRTILPLAKLAAVGTLALVVGCLGTGLYLVLSYAMFGSETVDSSIQLYFSCIALPNLTIRELLKSMAAMGMLTLLNTMAVTLLISALSNRVETALGVSLLACLLPSILTMLPASNLVNWVGHLLPTGGTGLLNSFQYELTSFTFLRLGSLAFYSPRVLQVAAVIELPLFMLLAGLVYKKRSRHGWN